MPSSDESLEEAYHALIKQTVQLVTVGKFTYRDLCSMESRERRKHYDSLAEMKKEEKDAYEGKANNPSGIKPPRPPSMPQVPRMPKVNLPRFR